MPQPTPLAATDILVDRQDGMVAVVTINRAVRRNAMTLAMWQELRRVFTELGDCPDVRAIVLTDRRRSASCDCGLSEADDRRDLGTLFRRRRRPGAVVRFPDRRSDRLFRHPGSAALQRLWRRRDPRPL
jgi:enoyl-CoA hydratase/carnithine racemase